MTTDWQAICDKGIGWAREGGNNNAKGIGGWFVEEIIPLEPRTKLFFKLTSLTIDYFVLGIFPKLSICTSCCTLLTQTKKWTLITLTHYPTPQ